MTVTQFLHVPPTFPADDRLGHREGGDDQGLQQLHRPSASPNVYTLSLFVLTFFRIVRSLHIMFNAELTPKMYLQQGPRSQGVGGGGEEGDYTQRYTVIT